jgi:hypothetical protein
MFSGCSSLTTAPELPATTLARECYRGIFENCVGLNSITVAFTNWDIINCTMSWAEGVASTGTFNCPEELPVEYGSGRIPKGWTVKSINEPEEPEEPTPEEPTVDVAFTVAGCSMLDLNGD